MYRYQPFCLCILFLLDLRYCKLLEVLGFPDPFKIVPYWRLACLSFVEGLCESQGWCTSFCQVVCIWTLQIAMHLLFDAEALEQFCWIPVLLQNCPGDTQPRTLNLSACGCAAKFVPHPQVSPGTEAQLLHQFLQGLFRVSHLIADFNRPCSFQVVRDKECRSILDVRRKYPTPGNLSGSLYRLKRKATIYSADGQQKQGLRTRMVRRFPSYYIHSYSSSDPAFTRSVEAFG